MRYANVATISRLYYYLRPIWASSRTRTDHLKRDSFTPAVRVRLTPLQKKKKTLFTDVRKKHEKPHKKAMGWKRQLVTVLPDRSIIVCVCVFFFFFGDKTHACFELCRLVFLDLLKKKRHT